MKHLIALLALVTTCTTVGAQVRCTMPNGVVIEQKLSNTCPVGASKGEMMDGTPIAVTLPKPPEPKRSPPAKQPTQAPPTKQTHTPTAYDDAQAICSSVLSTGAATSCEVDSNMFSTNIIDMTIPQGVAAANMLCNALKTELKRAHRPIVSRSANWEIRFFSPFGANNRPMARCVL